MTLQCILCSAFVVVAAACSGDCLPDQPEEQLVLVQRHASMHLESQANFEDPRELSAKESQEAALSAMMELAPDNTIRVKSRQNMCLNAAGGSNSAGDKIILWGCVGGAVNEQFEYRATDNTIRVKSKPNMCFNVENGALVQGANLVLWSCTGAANEKFLVRSDNTIRVVGTGLCLNAMGATFNNGDQIILWPCSGASNEEFVPNTGAPTQAPTVPVGKWTLTREHSVGQLLTEVTEFCGLGTDTFTVKATADSWHCQNQMDPPTNGWIVVNQNGEKVARDWFCTNEGTTTLKSSNFVADPACHGSCGQGDGEAKCAASSAAQ